MFSVWSIKCDGSISAGILGGQEFRFYIANGYLMSTTIPSNRAKRNVSIWQRQDSGNTILVGLPDAPPPTETIDEPRCPSANEVATVRSGARPVASNGCGPQSGLTFFPPNLVFTLCCYDHDFCYGKTFPF